MSPYRPGRAVPPRAVRATASNRCDVSDILDELEWRGLIAQSTDRDALRRDLDGGVLTLYAGSTRPPRACTPATSCRCSRCAGFQQAGARPIVLAGGATGMIGDPRDVGERALQTVDTVRDWAERIRGQLERFVDFDDSPTGALVVNNLDWTGAQTVLEFLRDVGKHFSVNVMLAGRRSGAGSRPTACPTPSSATCSCRARTTCICTGGTAAGCRSAAPTSGATSSAGST